jgi:energy-coupling factor transporter transmembrane protein EcfT
MTQSVPWVIWLFANLVVLLSTRNPFLLILILLLLFVVGAKLAKTKQQTNWVGRNIRFLGTMILLSTVINFLFTHTGQTLLFTLPKQWLLVGGKYTLESLVYGAINGLVIGAVYILFNIFNLALSIKQITRLIPRALHPLTLMVTISLTFFPSIQERTRQIREAQLIRGNPMKKVSDWLPVLIPLLVTSMENAVSLSESMTARGFQSTRAKSHTDLGLISLILALFALFAGWILQLFKYPLWISWTLYILSATIIIGVIVITGKSEQSTRLEQPHWQMGDFVAVGLLAVSFGFFLWFHASVYSTLLTYIPYPSLSMPGFNILLLGFDLIPAVPLFFMNHD